MKNERCIDDGTTIQRGGCAEHRSETTRVVIIASNYLRLHSAGAAGSINKAKLLALAKQLAALATVLILSLSLSINQRRVLLSFRDQTATSISTSPARRGRRDEQAGKQAGRDRQAGRERDTPAGMLRGLIVSRAFERSDFTATVFSNDFPPLKASHSFSLLLSVSLPLYLSLFLLPLLPVG